jgi:hypothetical protein
MFLLHVLLIFTSLSRIEEDALVDPLRQHEKADDQGPPQTPIIPHRNNASPSILKRCGGKSGELTEGDQ